MTRRSYIPYIFVYLIFIHHQGTHNCHAGKPIGFFIVVCNIELLNSIELEWVYLKMFRYSNPA